ncbi:craniofacial development protein 2-like [Aphis craccivora]|uniref:Craniofacial development protein 2-like n=1 Tax=Aphis craccivora TaxID=307492 RepID=A0A6G0ZJN4_APHCR|nr:craniofacial development protein 2-like [Aphis craccivora]
MSISTWNIRRVKRLGKWRKKEKGGRDGVAVILRGEEIESMYDQLEDLVTLVKDNSNYFIKGDFNAAVSCHNISI